MVDIVYSKLNAVYVCNGTTNKERNGVLILSYNKKETMLE